MNWDALEAEFDAWRAAELTLPFWWRDDDAVDETPALRRLMGVSERFDIPAHLAVIPTGFSKNLLTVLNQNKNLIPIVHGYAHQSHSSVGEKKCEFPEGRNLSDVSKELQSGFNTLTDALGDGLAPLFVPPWNRFDSSFLSVLQAVGYKGISTFTPRQNRWATAGLEQVNTHVDPIDWRGLRSLADQKTLLNHTVRSLRDRRLGDADNSEPFGFLTHHLVHDEAIWGFTEQFLEQFAAGPVRLWTAWKL